MANPAPARPNEAAVCTISSPEVTIAVSDAATSENGGSTAFGSSPEIDAACQAASSRANGTSLPIENAFMGAPPRPRP